VQGLGNFATKLVAMATSLKISEKEGRIDHPSAIQYLPYGAKIVKIGPADPEIALLTLKK